MSEAGVGVASPGGVTAGRLLREARQAQGLHIAALASAIKVAPRKLELLESDRIGELPDATFTRALAQTVCRSLKIDAAPILALLPPPSGYRLEQVGEGLNTPFRERPARLVPNDWASLANPAVWGPALVLLAAGAVYLMPSRWLPGLSTLPHSAPDAASPADRDAVPVRAVSSEPAAPALAGAGVVTDSAGGVSAMAPAASPAVVVAALPLAGAAASDAAGTAAAAELPKLLQLHARGDSWIEVVDARGHALLARIVRAGETVDLDGAAPFRLRIGNASGTEVVFRGRPLALAPFTRDNLARLELK